MTFMALAISSCEKDDFIPYNGGGNHGTGGGTDGGSTISTEIQTADKFAKEYMETYYLWNDEIDSSISQLDYRTCTDPVGTVERIRYKDDRWTKLYEDISVLSDYIDGVQTTFGYYIKYGWFNNSDTMFGIVAFVYDGSPAQKAGLKRGDFILTINGEDITEDNINLLFDASSLTLGLGVLNNGYVDETGEEVTLAAVNMYEYPILAKKVLNVKGKKVGYLAYTSFDLNSLDDLISTFKGFKSEGIEDLVLDMRYNGGGYVITEEALASMLAPEVNVQNHDVYQKTVYNKIMTDYYNEKGTSLVSRFSTEFSYTDENDKEHNLSTKNSNPGIKNLYVLVTENSASATEGLIVGLSPYMNVKVIGKQTHGKFCTGVIFKAEGTKNYSSLRKWGLYCMIGSFSDCNGNNPCRPDGIKPVVEVQDYPAEGYALGDENETMLRTALDMIAGSIPGTKTNLAMASPRTKNETLSFGNTRTLLPKNHVDRRILTPEALR